MAEFKEFPKRLYPNGPARPSVLVLNAEEEAEALGAAARPEEGAASEPATKPEPASKAKPDATAEATPDRKALIAAAKEKGVKKPTFMSNADLQEALAKFDHDGDGRPGGSPKGGNKRAV